MLIPATLIFLAASLAVDVPTVAGVDFAQSVERYTVTAVSSRSLIEQMEALGPRNPQTGRRSLGYTQGDVGVSFNYSETGDGKCELTDIEVGLTVKITLPDWLPSAKPGRRLEAQWQAFSAALTGHELQHRDILITGAKNVRATLGNMPVVPCGEIEATVNAATAPIMEEMNEASRSYDSRTEHGRTEGAWWLVW